MGISYSTFKEWQIKFPAFSAAIKKGREPIAEKIEESLYSRCIWKEVKEEVIEQTYDAAGNVTGSRKRITKKQVPPSEACIFFALKNLKPNKWKERPVEKDEDSKQAHEALIAAIRNLRDD